MSAQPFLAAAVQWAPGLTLSDGVERAIAAIEEASAAGASLIVFPETWIPSYPYFHSRSADRDAFTRLYEHHFEHSMVGGLARVDPHQLTPRGTRRPPS